LFRVFLDILSFVIWNGEWEAGDRNLQVGLARSRFEQSAEQVT
jgi:hypothetical protein